ncbi:STAS domain-containing protein [Streptomyces sp. NPDC088745]|uniref:STAS domain-containing protein n=1 Tax=Streptomyces sp. NPDC088745 TaxID=3365884 RepID=UPI00380FC8B0
MTARVRQGSGCWVISIAGHAHYADEDALNSALKTTIGTVLPAVIIDVSALVCSGASFLHWLLTARRTHQYTDTHLILAGPLHSALRNRLNTTGLTPHFTLADDLQAALNLAAHP